MYFTTRIMLKVIDNCMSITIEQTTNKNPDNIETLK